MTTNDVRRWSIRFLGCTLGLVALTPRARAHDPRDELGPHEHALTRVWCDEHTGQDYTGALLAVSAGRVTLELDAGGLVSLPIAELAPDDRAVASAAAERAAAQQLAFAGAGPQSTPTTAPAPWQSAPFAAFGPHVQTRWDARWLYVESDGLPHAPLDFTPMKGIRAWQQQVPLPQPYTGANAWQIPLAPELADTPVSARTALRRGAIALAANGIPIFNALNNRGEDAFAIGELDEFGGHCGRADDYHYHAAPLALQKVLGARSPIGFALDGFALYGPFDPAAGAQSERACPLGSKEPLDELNGHACTVPAGRGLGGSTRSYHYHASASYPYINGGMRGKVTVDGDQIVPQPRAQSVREAGTPLRGARITAFTTTGPGAWSLAYELDGKTYRVEYAIQASGAVRFDFVAPDGTRRTETFSRREARAGNDGAGTRPDRGGPDRGGRERRGTGERAEPRAPEPAQPLPSPSASASADFTLTSAALDANGRLAARCTCDGAGNSPPFAWSGVPAGTQSLALTVHHVPPEGGEHVYLVLWDLPATATGIGEAESKLGTFGINTVNRRAEWAPPCSQGPGEKTYVATLYALSARPALSASAGAATRAELLGVIAHTTLATATRELRYTRADPASGRAGEGRGGRRDEPANDGRGRGREARGDGGSQRRGGDADTFHTDVPAHDLDVVLAEPTSTSIRVTFGSSRACEALVEYARAGDERRVRTPVVELAPGRVVPIDVGGLEPDAEYRYRVVTRVAGEPERTGDERAFHTRRAAGSAFTFTITADSHLDSNVEPDVFVRTLDNVRADQPDFHVDLGDTFMTDKRRDFHDAAAQYDAQRWYFGRIGAQAPLFLALGNHDGEAGYAAGPGSIGAWSYELRTQRFPPPRIGDTYSGRTSFEQGRGANWFAFTWGDALLVVLDPFWPTTERVRGSDAKEGFTDGSWARTLGREQYDWLASTLATTRARHRFVFTHHLVGGRGREARGGAESAPYFEWGGKNADGSDGFAKQRPGWPMPIHALLVKYGVEAVFHGHDHLFVHGELDGIVYQCVPQPGNPLGGTRSAAEYGYVGGTILGSPGHLRVRVTPDAATIEFVRAALEEASGRGGERELNGSVVHAYTLRPRAATTDGK